MDECTLMKILIASGGAASLGTGGYYVKGWTGVAVGALAGGVIGYLLAPPCEEAVLPSQAPSAPPRTRRLFTVPVIAPTPEQKVAAMRQHCPAFHKPVGKDCVYVGPSTAKTCPTDYDYDPVVDECQYVGPVIR
ncbi:MAG: YtxH domain-containing protein [Planctomycetota bacterium]|jgi:hypothetical protein